MKFPPDRRVRKSPEFQKIQKQGRRVSTKHFIWILMKGEEGAPSRLGITASKRAGNSVRRSRLKRIVRAAFIQLEGMVPPGVDLVVICRRDAPDIGSDTAVQEWRESQKRVQKALEKLELAS